MTPPAITLDTLRSGDPEVMLRYFNVLVRMARRCIPADVDAEVVAREAMDEVLSQIASDKKPLPIKMLTRLAVSGAARRATEQFEQASGPTRSPAVTPDMLRGGDPDAIRRFFAMLVRMARRYIPSPAEAESVAREAMTEVLARLDRNEEPVDLVVWARTAVGRAARKVIRRYKQAPVTFQSRIHTDDEDTPRSSIQHDRDQLVRIHGVIETLPKVTQQAIVATAVDGRTIESVADELGMPASTLRNQLRRARAKFQQELSSAETLDRMLRLARQVQRARMKDSDVTPPAFRRRRSSSDESSTVQ